MHLTTARLVLREFRPGDFTPVHAFASDPEVTRYTDWGPNNPAETRAFLSDAAATGETLPRTRFPLAITRQDDDVPLGSAELHVTDPDTGLARIGYVLARPSWGHGFATETAEALLRHAFTALRLTEVAATCDPANTASARVLTKIGMSCRQHLPRHVRRHGTWHDRFLFSVPAPA